MNEIDFTEAAKKIIKKYSNEKNKQQISLKEIYVVWNCKTLQNNKALLSTPVPDGRYYEVTYDGDKKRFYFDAYIKEHNESISI